MSHTDPSGLRDALLATYAINDAMNQLLLSNLDRRAWRAPPPGPNPRGGRTIAAIFSHLHNSRLTWIRNSAPHLMCPAPLDPRRCTTKQAGAALRKSARQCLKMLREALSEAPNRRVTRFRRGWMPEWRPTGTMFAYMFAHEVHHRAQVVMLAHQLGFRLPNPAAYGIWHWDKLWKQAGLARPS